MRNSWDDTLATMHAVHLGMGQMRPGMNNNTCQQRKNGLVCLYGGETVFEAHSTSSHLDYSQSSCHDMNNLLCCLYYSYAVHTLRVQ